MYHLMIFILIPRRQEKTFLELPTLVFFYLLKLLSFLLSALQIKDGYPPDVSKRALTNHSQPGNIHALVFQIYRAIPFAYEIRTFLDWAITPSTLSIYEWLKFEDIYAELFLVKCRLVVEKAEARPFGQVQPLWYKILAGGGVIVLLVCILWIPLLPFMSGISGLGDENPVESVVLKMGIRGYVDLYISSAPKKALDLAYLPQSQFKDLLVNYKDNSSVFNEDMLFAQYATFADWSEDTWVLSPAALDKLVTACVKDYNISLYVELKFNRPKPDNQKQVTWRSVRPLSTLAKSRLAQALTNFNQRGVNSFVVDDVVPHFWHLLSTPAAVIPSLDSRQSVEFNLKFSNVSHNFTNEDGNTSIVTQFYEYWTVNAKPNPDDIPPFNSSTVNIVIVSNPIPAYLPEAFALTGVIGIYTVFVLGVGRFLRMGVAGLSRLAMYEDMPNVDKLLDHCKNVLYARQDGDTELEEELFRELIEIYRSPEKLLIWTSAEQKEA